jgi:hypothetical protein
LIADERDFFYEATAVLHFVGQSAAYISALEGIANPEQEGAKRVDHMDLPNFLAQSLVRLERGDVAAVAVYASKSAIKLYWSKNEISKVWRNLSELPQKKIRR